MIKPSDFLSLYNEENKPSFSNRDIKLSKEAKNGPRILCKELIFEYLIRDINNKIKDN